MLRGVLYDPCACGVRTRSCCSDFTDQRSNDFASSKEIHVVLDTGFYDVVCGSQIPIVSLILDSCGAVFQIPNPRIPDATCKNFPDSENQITGTPHGVNRLGNNPSKCFVFQLSQLQ